MPINDSSENNPMARKGVNPPVGTAGHEISIAELRRANVKGAPNPATVGKNLSDGDRMSGKEDRAGIPMTIAAERATRENDAILGKHEQELKVGHTSEDGKFVRTPPNTPNI
jgi:hypothetical protein